MKSTFAIIFLALSAVSFSVISAEPMTEAHVQKSLSQAVLDCHAHYARKFALSSTAASATEIAIGSEAHCKSEMDAYAQHDLDVTQKNSPVSDHKRQAAMVKKFKSYVFSYTVDMVVQARALP